MQQLDRSAPGMALDLGILIRGGSGLVMALLGAFVLWRARGRTMHAQAFGVGLLALGLNYVVVNVGFSQQSLAVATGYASNALLVVMTVAFVAVAWGFPAPMRSADRGLVALRWPSASRPSSR